MSERIRADLVCEVLRMAYRRRRPYGGLIVHTEPPRDSRRLHYLRGWSNGNTESVFTRGA